MAPPRLIPVPDSPQPFVQLPPEPQVGDTGKPPASFDRNCAPYQAPIGANVNYDPLSYGQLRELRKRRGYYKKDTKAVLKTRL